MMLTALGFIIAYLVAGGVITYGMWKIYNKANFDETFYEFFSDEDNIKVFLLIWVAWPLGIIVTFGAMVINLPSVLSEYFQLKADEEKERKQNKEE